MTVTNQAELKISERAVSGELAAVLSPLDSELFFEKYWNQKAVYIPGTPEKFAGLFDRDGFLRVARRCADLKVGYTDEKGWPAHFNIQPEQISEMLAASKTVCASVVDPSEPQLTAFLNEYRRSFRIAGKFFFNSYLSPEGAGFGLHLDHHPVSILQIEGRKRWWYSSKPGLTQVISNVSFPAGRDVLTLPWVTVERPAEESLCEVVLSPGDVLYLPKGCWHRAKALEHSLGLTLAMESVSLLDLALTALSPKLNTVDFRDALPAYPRAISQASMQSELDTIFASGLDRLRQLINDFSIADLNAVWAQVERQAQSVGLHTSKSSAASLRKMNSV
jgi:ribosomal protein L16 Arg81 hydroxylase